MADDQPMQTPNRLLSSGRAELSQSLDLWSKELDDLQDSIAQLSTRSKRALTSVSPIGRPGHLDLTFHTPAAHDTDLETPILGNAEAQWCISTQPSSTQTSSTQPGAAPPVVAISRIPSALAATTHNTAHNTTLIRAVTPTRIPSPLPTPPSKGSTGAPAAGAPSTPRSGLRRGLFGCLSPPRRVAAAVGSADDDGEVVTARTTSVAASSSSKHSPTSARQGYGQGALHTAAAPSDAAAIGCHPLRITRLLKSPPRKSTKVADTTAPPPSTAPTHTSSHSPPPASPPVEVIQFAPEELWMEEHQHTPSNPPTTRTPRTPWRTACSHTPTDTPSLPPSTAATVKSHPVVCSPMSDMSVGVGGGGMSAGPSPLQQGGPARVGDGRAGGGGGGGGGGEGADLGEVSRVDGQQVVVVSIGGSCENSGGDGHAPHGVGGGMLTIAALQQLKHQQGGGNTTTTTSPAQTLHATRASSSSAMGDTARQLAFAPVTCSTMAALRAPGIAAAAAAAPHGSADGGLVQEQGSAAQEHAQQPSARYPTSHRSIASSHFSIEPDEGLLTAAMTHAWALTNALTDVETDATAAEGVTTAAAAEGVTTAAAQGRAVVPTPMAAAMHGAQHSTLTLHADGSCDVVGEDACSDNRVQKTTKHKHGALAPMQVGSAPPSARNAQGLVQLDAQQQSQLQQQSHPRVDNTPCTQHASPSTRTPLCAAAASESTHAVDAPPHVPPPDAHRDQPLAGRRDMALQTLKERRTQALLLRRHVSASEADVMKAAADVGWMRGGGQHTEDGGMQANGHRRATVDGQVHHHTPPPITLSHIPRAPSHTNPSPAGLQSAHPAGPTSPTALRVQRGAVRKMSTRSPPHSPHATRVGGHQSKAGNAGQEGSAGRSVGAPKPFLRRKAVASPATTRRMDWSHVPARTISHLDPALIDVKRVERQPGGRRAAGPTGKGTQRGGHVRDTVGASQKKQDGSETGVDEGPYSDLILQVTELIDDVRNARL